jgi:hypothetical protein
MISVALLWSFIWFFCGIPLLATLLPTAVLVWDQFYKSISDQFLRLKLVKTHLGTQPSLHLLTLFCDKGGQTILRKISPKIGPAHFC